MMGGKDKTKASAQRGTLLTLKSIDKRRMRKTKGRVSAQMRGGKQCRGVETFLIVSTGKKEGSEAVSKKPE